MKFVVFFIKSIFMLQKVLKINRSVKFIEKIVDGKSSLDSYSAVKEGCEDVLEGHPYPTR